MKIEILHIVGCESVSTLQILKLEVVTEHPKDRVCKTDDGGPTHGPFPQALHRKMGLSIFTSFYSNTSISVPAHRERAASCMSNGDWGFLALINTIAGSSRFYLWPSKCYALERPFGTQKWLDRPGVRDLRTSTVISLSPFSCGPGSRRHPQITNHRWALLPVPTQKSRLSPREASPWYLPWGALWPCMRTGT